MSLTMVKGEGLYHGKHGSLCVEYSLHLYEFTTTEHVNRMKVLCYYSSALQRVHYTLHPEKTGLPLST